jgi:glutamyl-tRNA reductase
VRFACLGLSHRTAPAEVRERHSFGAARICEALIALRDYESVREAAIISTCNRLEIYAELEDGRLGFLQLKEFLINFRHGDIAYDIEPYLYSLHGREAVEHLFRVATGLDSMLIGDAEVLGQVKAAYGHARRSRSLGQTLHRAFRDAINAGKAARSRTAIGNESVSIATAAIAKAREHVGAFAGKDVLLIGAGKMGSAAAKRLKVEGAGSLTIVNRTYERAEALVEKLGVGQALDPDSLAAALEVADVVISSTDAPHFVLTYDTVDVAMRVRCDRPLLLIDVAIPRDVDPEVAKIPGVCVYDIDTMNRTVDRTLEHRRAAIPFVEEIIREHIEAFEDWYRSRSAIPVIASLAQKAESIRNSELERLFGRCPDLSERERVLVSGMSLTIVSKLLHSAITRIRDDAGGEGADAEARVRIIDDLFELRLDQPKSRTAYRAAFSGHSEGAEPGPNVARGDDA